MKNVRQLCAAVMLTLALTLSAFADGNMTTGVAASSPSSADGQITTWVAGQMSTSVAGQIGTGVAGQIDTTVAGHLPTTNNVASPVDPMTQLALVLLQGALCLF